jgi:hypothetical protein
MQRLKGRKTKFALVLTAVVLIVAVILLSGATVNIVRNPLTDAIESGESTLTAIDRNHQSMTDFAGDQQELARELLETAQASQEQANASLTYARHTNDEFVLNMAQNYAFLLDSSDAMNQGADHLLTVDKDLQNALNYYWQQSYKSAADSASTCLQTLEPLVDQFNKSNQTLDGINYRYLASGNRDQVKYAVGEFKDAMTIYLQYVQLLRSIKEGAAYMQETNKTNDLLNQLQDAVANNENATQLLEEISNQLEHLKDPQFQNATSLASQLDPSLLSGLAQNTAHDLKNQLKDIEGIDRFQNYLKAVEKYNQASMYLSSGDKEKAQQAADQALAMLPQGKGQSGEGDDVQSYSAALEFALNSLKMQIRGQPDQG